MLPNRLYPVRFMSSALLLAGIFPAPAEACEGGRCATINHDLVYCISQGESERCNTTALAASKAAELERIKNEFGSTAARQYQQNFLPRWKRECIDEVKSECRVRHPDRKP